VKITIETGEWSGRKTLIGIGLIAAIAAVALAAVLILSGGNDGGNSDQTTTLSVPSGSMEPTLKADQKININLDAYAEQLPEVGNVVVFYAPNLAESEVECDEDSDGLQPVETGESCPVAALARSTNVFVKRIVAIGGDTVSIKDGHAVVNGVEEAEPFVKPCGGGYECNLPKTITVPSGDYFMLGDNRGESDDSRYWGPIPGKWIIGKVEE
jgi:signal peptidase I